jgi:hypothetical protein
MTEGTSQALDLDGLRHRSIPQQANPDEAPKLVQELNKKEEELAHKDAKTYGRTPDGTSKLLIKLKCILI